jgi:hypothetical protein
VIDVTGDEITISVALRHGRQKRHKFYWGRNREWVRVEVMSTKQKRERVRSESQQQSEPWHRPSPRMPLGARPYDRVRDYTTIHLARGVDLSASALEVILNALRSGRRPEVDLDDVKVVLSQLGSRIERLDGLPADTRRHAEQALYTEILKRCSIIS